MFRDVCRAVIVCATAVVVSGTAVLAGDIKPSKKFELPPLGLGADIPDEILFKGDTDGLADHSWDARALPFALDKTAKTNGGPSWTKAPADTGWAATVQTEKSRNSGKSCLSHTAILNDMADAGWHSMQRVRVRPGKLAVSARLANGPWQRVQLNRCTGKILHVSATYID